MITLPEEFKNSIVNSNHKVGVRWLNNIDKLLKKYTNKYELEDIKLSNELSLNLILFAKSRRYGDIALKMTPSTATATSEYNVLKNYSSKYSEICYDYNKKDKVMILELLSPATPLLKLDNLEERIKIFSNIAINLMFKPENKCDFKSIKSFEKRFNKRVVCVEKNKEEFLDIINVIHTGIQFYKEFKKNNFPKYVLHGDLHHNNILKSGDKYKAIDPNGLIAERVFEIPPFILGEFRYCNIHMYELDNIISLTSKYFKEDKELIKKALYITIVEKVVWHRHSKHDEKIISKYIDICNYLYRCKLKDGDVRRLEDIVKYTQELYKNDRDWKKYQKYNRKNYEPDSFERKEFFIKFPKKN